MSKNTWTPLTVCSGPLLVRDKPLGAPAFVRLAYWVILVVISINKYTLESLTLTGKINTVGIMCYQRISGHLGMEPLRYKSWYIRTTLSK